MSDSAKEQTRKNIGQEIIAAAEKTSGLSPIPVETLKGNNGFKQGSLYTKQKNVYLQFDSSGVNFEEFFDHLPTTIRRVIQIIPYENDIVLISGFGIPFKEDRTNLGQNNSEQVETTTSLWVNLMDYLNTVIMKEDNTISKAKKSGERKIKLHKDDLGSADTHYYGSIEWLSRLDLGISKIELVRDDSSYVYECTLVKQNSDLFSHIVQSFQFIQLDSCEECGSSNMSYRSMKASFEGPERVYDISKMNNYSLVFSCNDCLQYYEIPLQSVINIIINKDTTEINAQITSGLEKLDKLSQDKLINQERRKVKNEENGIEFEQIPFENGSVIYRFTEDEIMMRLIYKNLHLHRHISLSDTWGVERPKHFDIDLCSLCNEYTETVALGEYSNSKLRRISTIKGRVNMRNPELSETEVYTSGAIPVLCEECIAKIEDLIEENLYKAKSEEELFTHFI